MQAGSPTEKPNPGPALAARGEELLRLGRFPEACDALVSAIASGINDVIVWVRLAQAMSRLSFSAPNDQIRGWLQRLAEHPAIPPGMIGGAVIRYMGLAPAFAESWARAQSATFALQIADLQAMNDVLLLALLSRSPAREPAMERLVTGARRALLFSDIDAPSLRCAVAASTMAGEYALAETSEEIDRLDAIDAKVLGTGQVSVNEVSSYAAYRSLHLAPWARQLPREGWPAPFDKMIRVALLEPLADAALRETIPALGTISGEVSAGVRAQYEANPYPRWQITPPPPPQALPVTIQRVHPKVSLAGLQWSAEPNILIAGCGTGRQAIESAQRHPNAKVLAIDLSLSSLAYAKRKATEAGVTNIEFAQADLTELDLGTRQFDLVESVGVLHHIEHPVEGWRRLAAMVRPGGLMMIGLYSRAARAWLAGLREQYGIRTDPAGIRAFRQQLIASEPNHPILATGDFYSLSECRDLVFHVQETQFTLPEIKAALGELGLRFLGFAMPADQLAAYDARFTADPTRTDLDNWAVLEAEHPTMFIGMYQFWVMKTAS